MQIFLSESGPYSDSYSDTYSDASCSPVSMSSFDDFMFAPPSQPAFKFQPTFEQPQLSPPPTSCPDSPTAQIYGDIGLSNSMNGYGEYSSSAGARRIHASGSMNHLNDQYNNKSLQAPSLHLTIPSYRHHAPQQQNQQLNFEPHRTHPPMIFQWDSYVDRQNALSGIDPHFTAPVQAVHLPPVLRDTRNPAKPFRCLIRPCNQTFTRDTDRKRHVEAVHEKKKFSCPVCEKKFARLDALKIHRTKTVRACKPKRKHVGMHRSAKNNIQAKSEFRG